MIPSIQNQAIRKAEKKSDAPKPCEAKGTTSPFAKTLGRVRNEKTRSEIYSSVMTSSAKHNLPPELVLAVIKQESGFKPGATSHCGASGLMQLMPETAKDLGVQDRYDIQQNIEGGCKYLRELSDRYNGNTELTLAAYNAGPGNVDKHGGVPPFEETQNYVQSVQSHLKEFQGAGMDRSFVIASLEGINFSLTPNLLRTRPEKSDTSSSAEKIPFGRRV